MIRRFSIAAAVLTCAAALLIDRPASAYSVLAHEATVDALWDDEIVPLLRQRFPGLTAERLAQARAHAYGGSLIQDLGYYPFGSHQFTNLTHYVRSGDFVESMIHGATDANEYAFALGALAHYASDNTGHPLAVNRAVPIMYPKVRAKTGSEALYVESPTRHVMVEFAFDVLQVARGEYAAQAYRERIGFEVSKALLERAVLDTYGIELDDMLLSVDLAIGTYRRAVSTTIPELTRIAWREKREEIEKATPGITEQRFVFALSRRDYEAAYGTDYKKPGLFARFLALVLKILPKVGPLKPLAFQPLTPEAERLFMASVAQSRARYRAALQALGRGAVNLPNTDFETGRAPTPGENRLADETYADLLHDHGKRNFVNVPPQLRRELDDYLSRGVVRAGVFSRKQTARIRQELAAMNGRR